MKASEQGNPDDVCARAQLVGGFDAALRLITGKWKAEILWCLTPGKRRFGELLTALRVGREIRDEGLLDRLRRRSEGLLRQLKISARQQQR